MSKAFRMSVMAAMVLALVLGGATLSQAIEVREGGTGGTDLKVDFAPVKAVFQKGESIQFTVKGNQPYYVYLFSIDKASNKGYLLLPNDKQKDNMFAPGRTYVLPGGNIEFFSDKVGTEKVIMVASTEQLKLDTGGYSKAGAFFEGSDAQMEEGIKSLRVREGGSNKQVFKELDLVIVGN
jgi:hypothetical protein